MNIRKALALSALFVLGAVVAEPVIKITTDKPIQQENLLKNGDFKENLKYWTGLPVKSDGSQFSFEKLEGATGEKCLQITGEPSLERGVTQRIRFEPPLAAGEPLLISMRIKKSGCDSEKKKFGGMALHASWDKSTLAPGEAPNKYLPVFEFIREDHDWVYRYYEVPAQSKPIIAMSLYLCYYNNEGVCAFDDVRAYRGTANATIEVTGDDVREITVLHTIRGKLLSEKLNGNAVRKLEVPAYGAIAVAVTSADGKVSWARYPDDVDGNVKASENTIPLGSIKRYFLTEADKTMEFIFDRNSIPAGKKAYLEFNARINGAKIAGHSHALRVTVNGKLMTEKEIVKPCREFTSSTGKVYRIHGSSSYLVFYSPACFAIDTENPYCPATIPSRNPFEFKVDISQALQDGVNKVSFFNSSRFNPKFKPVDVIENPRITIE